ncbi:uncharacterized protein DS421_10g305310 [Arachis hypogaea]|nr:uncharacterized protein DS421_10g305310 [Arachis hypogaea]
MNMADLVSESPIIDIPEHLPWFNPEEDQVVPDVPMPDALPPSPVVEPGFDGPRVPESSSSAPSTEFSSEAWIDQMMVNLYSSSFETREEIHDSRLVLHTHMYTLNIWSKVSILS